MGHEGILQLIGHRGAAAHAPENTMISFEKAISMGATMLELDVHLSKDEELVVIHDLDLARTTFGKGLVSDMTLAEIILEDAGGRKGPEFKGERIPVLRQVMEFTRRGVGLNIEIKAGDGPHLGLVDKLLPLIMEYNALDMVVISSFHREYLQEIKAKLPQLEVALLYSTAQEGIFDEVAQRGWEGLHPHYSMINPAYMEAAKAKGLAIRAWTVNDPNDMQYLMDLGVDGIVTDYPDVLKSIVERRRL